MENKEVIADSQHILTNGKSCLKKSVAFYNDVTVFVNKGSTSDLIYLDLGRSFDTVLCNTLDAKLARCGFDGLTTQWTRHC